MSSYSSVGSAVVAITGHLHGDSPTGFLHTKQCSASANAQRKLDFSHPKTQSCFCRMESKVRALGPNCIIAFRSKFLNKPTTTQTFAMVCF